MQFCSPSPLPEAEASRAIYTTVTLTVCCLGQLFHFPPLLIIHYSLLLVLLGGIKRNPMIDPRLFEDSELLLISISFLLDF